MSCNAIKNSLNVYEKPHSINNLSYKEFMLNKFFYYILNVIIYKKTFKAPKIQLGKKMPTPIENSKNAKIFHSPMMTLELNTKKIIRWGGKLFFNYYN